MVSLPDDLSGQPVYLLDPMLATGGSMRHAIDVVAARGATDITAVCVVAAPEESRPSPRPDVPYGWWSGRSTTASMRTTTSCPGSATLAIGNSDRVTCDEVLLHTGSPRTVAIMCRNIHTLHNFDPPATSDEVSAAALQYVRKIAGTTKPSKANRDAFDQAVAEIAHSTRHLLDALVTTAPQEPRGRSREEARSRRGVRTIRVKMHEVFDAVADGFELTGVVAMVVGFLVSFALAGRRLWRGRDGSFALLRTTMGGAILLGLEILVAADLVRTITLRAVLGKRWRPRHHRRTANGPEHVDLDRNRRHLAVAAGADPIRRRCPRAGCRERAGQRRRLTRRVRLAAQLLTRVEAFLALTDVPRIATGASGASAVLPPAIDCRRQASCDLDDGDERRAAHQQQQARDPRRQTVLAPVPRQHDQSRVPGLQV